MKLHNSFIELSLKELVAVSRSVENYEKYGVLPSFSDKEINDYIKNAVDENIAYSHINNPTMNIPSLGEIEEFCYSNHLSVHPYSFWKHCEENHWSSNGEPIRNWKGMIVSWDKKRKTTKNELDPVVKDIIKQLATWEDRR